VETSRRFLIDSLQFQGGQSFLVRRRDKVSKLFFDSDSQHPLQMFLLTLVGLFKFDSPAIPLEVIFNRRWWEIIWSVGISQGFVVLFLLSYAVAIIEAFFFSLVEVNWVVARVMML